jgi:hypothetical protein
VLKGYRLRAEVAGTAADHMRTPGSRETLRRIAEDYDLLADIMEPQGSAHHRGERNAGGIRKPLWVLAKDA